MAIDKDQHLAESLETHKMKHIQEKVDAFKAKADEVKGKLESHYGTDVYYSFRSGSFAKNTAINIKFDIDLVVPFKHARFDTLEDMYNDVFDFLSEEYKDGTSIRKQKVSIGLTFPADEKGYVVSLDVVPGRELNDNEYPESNDLNLYFNENHWGFKKGSRQKTNIQAQIDHISGKTDERKIIRLLKIWKNTNHKDYKSFMLELFTIKALKNYTGDKQLWNSLRYVMGYIAQNVTDESFQLIDPGNSNNNVLAAADTQSMLQKAGERLFDIIGQSTLESTQSTSESTQSTSQSTQSTSEFMLSSTAKEILLTIEQNSQITYDEIADKIGKARSGIARHIKNLREKGLLIAKGENGEWTVVKSPICQK